MSCPFKHRNWKRFSRAKLNFLFTFISFFLSRSFNVNLFHCFLVLPPPSSCTSVESRKKITNISVLGKQFYLLYCHHYLTLFQHRTHKNNKMSNYCYRKQRKSDKNCSVKLSWSQSNTQNCWHFYPRARVFLRAAISGYRK